MNKNYQKGVRYERRSMEILEAAGYMTLRMAGSHGQFDVIGISRLDIVLVQVKSGTANLTPAETEAMALFPVPPNTRKLLHRWKKGATLPLVKEIS